MQENRNTPTKITEPFPVELEFINKCELLFSVVLIMLIVKSSIPKYCFKMVECILNEFASCLYWPQSSYTWLTDMHGSHMIVKSGSITLGHFFFYHSGVNLLILPLKKSSFLLNTGEALL